MTNKTDWTPAEKRELSAINEAGQVVRTVQLVALAMGLWAAMFGNWGRFGVAVAAILFLQLLLPVLGPEWTDRARELDERNEEE